MVFSAAPRVSAAEADPVTVAQFANMLIEVLDIQLPEAAANFSEAELFEMQADILSRRGISLFADADPNALVTRTDLYSVLSDALTSYSSEEPEGKPSVTRGNASNVFYDAVRGYSKPIPEDIVAAYLDNLNLNEDTQDDIMNLEEILSALSIPELSGIVAEAYSPPGSAPVAGEIYIAAQNPTPEDPIIPAETPLSAVVPPRP